MSFSPNKKNNRHGDFLTLATMRCQSRDLFSNLKMEQKTGLCWSEELLSNWNIKSDYIAFLMRSCFQTETKGEKYPYIVSILNTASVPGEIPTKDPSHLLKEFLSAKWRNLLMEYPIGYPTDATSIMSTKNPSSNPRAHPISDPDVIKQGSQEAQGSLKTNLVLLILNFILS